MGGLPVDGVEENVDIVGVEIAQLRLRCEGTTINAEGLLLSAAFTCSEASKPNGADGVEEKW
jgi:hypothetical protein